MTEPGEPWSYIVSIVLLICLIFALTCAKTALSLVDQRQLVSCEAFSELKNEKMQNFAKNYLRKLQSLQLSNLMLKIITTGLLTIYLVKLGWHLSLVICCLIIWALIIFIGINQVVFKLTQNDPLKVLAQVSLIAQLFSYLLIPIITVSHKLFGIKNEQKLEDEIDMTPTSWQDVVEVIKEGQDSGKLDHDEFEMINGVISMQEKLAREVMVPRIDAFMVDIQNNNQRSIEDIIESNYSRVPVYSEDKDNIVGVIHVKNLLQSAFEYGFERLTIRQLMKPAFFVPETITLDTLLYKMRETQHQMAILLDEYGGIVGLVTLEDLLEEIVGEIEDETDIPFESYRRLNDNEFLVQGRLPLIDFDLDFGTDFAKTEDVDTIAGFFITQLGKIPKDHQKLSVKTSEGVILQTVEVSDGKIDRLKVTLPEQNVQFFNEKEQNKMELRDKMDAGEEFDS